MLDLAAAVERPSVWGSTRVCSAKVISHCGLITDGGRLVGRSSRRVCIGDGEPVCRWIPLHDSARTQQGLTTASVGAPPCNGQAGSMRAGNSTLCVLHVLARAVRAGLACNRICLYAPVYIINKINP